MPYTWTARVHTTAGRTRIHLETWVHMSHGWELAGIMECDTRDRAHEVAKMIREDHTFLDKFRSPVIIAAVRFSPRDHHRLVTWYGTYNEGNIDA